MEPQTIRRTNCRSDTRKPPAATCESMIRLSDVSGTTAIRKEDGRIREELESLGRSGAYKVMTRLRSLDWR